MTSRLALAMLFVSAAVGGGAPTASAQLVPGPDNSRIDEYTVDPRTLEHVTHQQRQVIEWYERYMLELRTDYAQLTKYQEAYYFQGKDVREIDDHRQALSLCLKNAPRLADSYQSGGSGGWIPLYLYRIRAYVSDGAFRQYCAPHIKAVRQALSRYQAETKDWIAQRDKYGANAPATGEKPRSAAWEPFQVFRAGNDMLVGQISTLKEIPSCQLKGWGRDCDKKVGAAAALKPVSPAFEKYEDAIKYYCDHFKSKPEAVMLTGGRDATAEWGDEGKVNVQNGPSCPKAPAASSPSALPR